MHTPKAAATTLILEVVWPGDLLVHVLLLVVHLPPEDGDWEEEDVLEEEAKVIAPSRADPSALRQISEKVPKGLATRVLERETKRDRNVTEASPRFLARKSEEATSCWI